MRHLKVRITDKWNSFVSSVCTRLYLCASGLFVVPRLWDVVYEHSVLKYSDSLENTLTTITGILLWILERQTDNGQYFLVQYLEYARLNVNFPRK